VQQEAHAALARPLLVMLRTEPGVRATVVEWRRRWQDLLEPAVAERLPRRRAGSSPDVRAAAIVASALSCLETAQGAWAEHPDSRLSTLLDQAMTTVTA
jgi:ABC-type Fe3+ transport system substrate-binding protein